MLLGYNICESVYTWLLFTVHAILVIVFPLCMQNKTVSVFETNIRILGGLLSAHLIASDYATVCLLNPILFLLRLLYNSTYFLITLFLVWHEKYILIDIAAYYYNIYQNTAWNLTEPAAVLQIKATYVWPFLNWNLQDHIGSTDAHTYYWHHD